MSQAERIRSLISEMFSKSIDIKKDIVVNNKKVKGIRYSDLKKELLQSDQKFTDGAVTGALYSLEDNMESIFKARIRDGVYFYMSEESPKNFKKDVVITESKEYEELVSKANDLYDDIGAILVNASNGNYKETYDLDVEYLRSILRLNSELKDALKDYKIEKSFEKIRDNNTIYVEESPPEINSDDLPF